MGDHTDDTGAQAAYAQDLRHQLEPATPRLELTPPLTDENNPVNAETELRLREALMRTAERLDQLPAELLHALRSAGPNAVWVAMDPRPDVLVLVSGSLTPDDAAERTVYRHLRGEGRIPASVALCGFWTQAYHPRLLGCVRGDQIIVNAGLGRIERLHARKRLALALQSRRRGHRVWLGALLPLPIALASLRSLVRGMRDMAISTVTTVGPSLASATATGAIVVAVTTSSQLPAPSSPWSGYLPGGGRAGPVTVAQSAPLGRPSTRASATPRPAAPSASPPLSALPVGEPTPAPAQVPADPQTQPPASVDPVPQTTAPEPAPTVVEPAPSPETPSPSMLSESTPAVTPSAEPAPTEPAPTDPISPVPAVTGEPPVEVPPSEVAPTDPPSDPAVPDNVPSDPVPIGPAPTVGASQPAVDADGDEHPSGCPLGVLTEGCIAA